MLATAPATHPPRSDAAPARLRSALQAGWLVLGWLPALCAAQLSPLAKQEIEGLLRAVGSSGCEFVRGSSVYTAAKAQDHLHQKFEYLDARAQLHSAEDFITKAGTRSSMTGQAYGIRCAGAAPQTSEDWLRARLQALRQPKRTP